MHASDANVLCLEKNCIVDLNCVIQLSCVCFLLWNMISYFLGDNCELQSCCVNVFGMVKVELNYCTSE